MLKVLAKARASLWAAPLNCFLIRLPSRFPLTTRSMATFQSVPTQQMCGKSAADCYPATLCSAASTPEIPFDLAVYECRRGDLDSYSTAGPTLIFGPELWLPAA